MKNTWNIAGWWLAMVLAGSWIWLSGCAGGSWEFEKEKNEKQSVPQFRTLYYEFLTRKESLSQSAQKKNLISITADQMPLREFLLRVNEKSNLSVICDAELDAKPITIDVVDKEVGGILSAVARRCGAEMIVQENVYYIGSLHSEDRGFLVRKVRRLSSEDIEKVVLPLLSEKGKVFTSADGLIVVGDRVFVLQRINSMLDDVEKQPANTWVLQMYLLAGSNKGQRDMGFETSIDLEFSADTLQKREATKDKTKNPISSLDVSAVFASATSKLVADSQFRAILKAARSSTDFTVLAEPMMLVVDGGEAKIRDGEKIPIPQKAISDSGTVTTIGYEYIDTGIIVSAAIREMAHSKANCTLSIDITQINGYVEGSPITTGQTFTTNTVLESGGTYLVGSMSKKGITKEKSGITFTTFRGHNYQNGTIMIWVRCYRINGLYVADS